MGTTIESSWENERLKDQLAAAQAHEAELVAHVERLRDIVENLWSIIDDIDTYGDMAKSDDKLFRSLVEQRQRERWKTGITTDGYKLDIGIPAQSLARLRNEVLEKAAKVCDEYADDPVYCGNAIRELKEPECSSHDPN